jgi:hypothetical protein
MPIWDYDYTDLINKPDCLLNPNLTTANNKWLEITYPGLYDGDQTGGAGAGAYTGNYYVVTQTASDLTLEQVLAVDGYHALTVSGTDGGAVTIGLKGGYTIPTTAQVSGLADYLTKVGATALYEPLGVTVGDITDATANGRSLISSANYASMRGLLDLEAGTDFYSISAADVLFNDRLTKSGAIALYQPIVTEGSLADSVIVSADIKNDTIDSDDYVAASIDEEHLNISNSGTDEYLLSYEADTGNFEWKEVTGGTFAGDMGGKPLYDSTDNLDIQDDVSISNSLSVVGVGSFGGDNVIAFKNTDDAQMQLPIGGDLTIAFTLTISNVASSGLSTYPLRIGEDLTTDGTTLYFKGNPLD